ncbi:hypothetical protein [Nonomuraea glycinis]|uniref:hypothetical protein n=1 Tax=Nonomuraea glycinis TaxID=2047744 RepID=UPI0033A672FF
MGTSEVNQEAGDGDRGGPNLTRCLFVQVKAEQAADFWSAGDHDGGGIVLSGADALRAASARARQMSRPVLADRRRYAGKNRPRGTARFAPAWIESQRAVNMATVLTDSGYVGQGDHEALEAILKQAASAGPDVCAVLPLHISWLADPGVKPLMAEVNQHEVPVALVLEHSGDPLGTQYAVNGLKRLLGESLVPVGLLSTDISGLGAMAYGAAWAAVGVTSSLRHLYPADRKGGLPFGAKRARHAIVPRLMTFMNVDRIAEGWANAQRHDDVDENLWRCFCVECGNRTMDRLVTCTELSLAAHNISILAELHQQVTDAASWEQAIGDALGCYDLLRHEYQVAWEPPAFMYAWLPRVGRRSWH